jgi:hypothetical protein
MHKMRISLKSTILAMYSDGKCNNIVVYIRLRCDCLTDKTSKNINAKDGGLTVLQKGFCCFLIQMASEIVCQSTEVLA